MPPRQFEAQRISKVGSYSNPPCLLLVKLYGSEKADLAVAESLGKVVSHPLMVDLVERKTSPTLRVKKTYQCQSRCRSS
jgi:hypothetical protein